MVIAAGKSAGNPPRMTDKAFKPPTEAAMAMTGKEPPAGEAAGFADWRFDLDFVFIMMLATPAEAGSPGSHPSTCLAEMTASRWLTGVEFTREPPHGPGRFYHQSLRAGDFILESFRVALRLPLQ